jgi:hypothetical protein
VSGVAKCKSIGNAKNAWNRGNRNKFRNSIAYAAGYQNLYRNIARNLVTNGTYVNNKSTQIRQLVKYVFLLKSASNSRTQKILGQKIGEILSDLYWTSQGSSRFKNGYSGILYGMINKSTGKKNIANIVNGYMTGNTKKSINAVKRIAKNLTVRGVSSASVRLMELPGTIRGKLSNKLSSSFPVFFPPTR